MSVDNVDRKRTEGKKMELINMTRFSTSHLVIPDGRGKEILLVVAKATFAISSRLVLIDEQSPVFPTDIYFGPPESSSIRYAGECVPVKPMTDVVLFGCAYPEKEGDTRVDVQLSCMTISKTVTVFGDRVWMKRGYEYVASQPRQIKRVPLRYERAFGGMDEDDTQFPNGCDSNPVGLGFASRRSKKEFEGQAVPNVLGSNSTIHSPNSRSEVAGFSWIAPHWYPRAKLAGTYDESWLKNRMPNLPADFEDRYFNAAPLDQQLADPLLGGERIEIRNATADGLLAFEVPKLDLILSVCIGDELLESSMRCDTLAIDTEERLVSMVWRSNLDVHQRVPSISWICVEQGVG